MNARFPCVLVLLFVLESNLQFVKSPPYLPNALNFNLSQQICSDDEVLLYCFYQAPSLLENIQLQISFVHYVNMTEQAWLLSTTSEDFLYPNELRKVHNDSGRILNETQIDWKSGHSDVIVTSRFKMNAEHVGSYVCRFRPIDVKEPDDYLIVRYLTLDVLGIISCPFLILWISIVFGTACLPVGFVMLTVVYWQCSRDSTFIQINVNKSFHLDVMKEEDQFRPSIDLVTLPRISYSLFWRSKLAVWRRSMESDGAPTASEKSNFNGSLRYKTTPMPGGPFENDCRSITSVNPHIYLFPKDPDYEIPFSKIRIVSRLGHGNFGLVFRGFVKNLPTAHNRSGDTIPVAIKTLRVNAPEADVMTFMQEIEIAKFIGQHPHIIKFYGTSSYKESPIIVMEFALGGSLVQYLKSNGMEISLLPHRQRNENLLEFAIQVADGMTYLSSKGIVHRDLAARNVVINEFGVIKIIDFGLTRRVDEYYRMMHSGALPLKWMSPESILRKVFAWYSDVWSFGVLMWEIFSLGESPLEDLSQEQYFALITIPFRHPQPVYADDDIYIYGMVPCWCQQPKKRPRFPVILQLLKEIKLRLVN